MVSQNATDLEVHGDGATVWPSYKVSVLSPMHDPRYQGRFSSRYEKPIGRFDAQGIQIHITMYRFQGHPKNLIELCRESLNRLEAVIQKGLAASADKSKPQAATTSESSE
ncbi:MAG TPA: hypothetical protein VIH56_03080 [Candidatus Acidoferrales bacterium]